MLVDNIVPSDSQIADAYNAWEKVRDPSHVQALSVNKWVGLCASADLQVTLTETAPKKMSFANWVDNMSVPDELQPGLLADLLDADDDIGAFLQPSGTTEANAVFVLTEGLVLAVKP